jgi:hypothetical protein
LSGRRTHLFVATAPQGELVFARRIASELQARGDRAVFVAPQAAAPLFGGDGIQSVLFTRSIRRLDRLIPRIIRTERCDSVVLVDAASVYGHLHWTKVNPDFLLSLDVPAIALDTWNLPDTGIQLDYGRYPMHFPPRSLDLSRRLIPAPYIRPARKQGIYNALRATAPPSSRERRKWRAELGLERRDRLVLMTTSAWQLPGSQQLPTVVRSARLLPELVAALLARVGPDLRVLHVGPRPDVPLRKTLQGRYHWRPQMPAARFSKLVAAADLLLSFNVSSTVIGSAIAAGLPVLVGMNSRECRTVNGALAQLPGRPSPMLRGWLRRAVPLHRFHLWPVGLFGFLSRVLARNPYRRAFRQVEVLEEETFVETCRALLFDPKVADAERERQAAYAELVRRLPTAADWMEQYLR